MNIDKVMNERHTYDQLIQFTLNLFLGILKISTITTKRSPCGGSVSFSHMDPAYYIDRIRILDRHQNLKAKKNRIQTHNNEN